MLSFVVFSLPVVPAVSYDISGEIRMRNIPVGCADSFENPYQGNSRRVETKHVTG